MSSSVRELKSTTGVGVNGLGDGEQKTRLVNARTKQPKPVEANATYTHLLDNDTTPAAVPLLDIPPSET